MLIPQPELISAFWNINFLDFSHFSPLTQLRYSPQTRRDWEETNSGKQKQPFDSKFSFYLKGLNLYNQVFTVVFRHFGSSDELRSDYSRFWKDGIIFLWLLLRLKRSDRRSWTPVTQKKSCSWLHRKGRSDSCRRWPNSTSRTQIYSQTVGGRVGMFILW